ncbi:MAG: ribose-phosphate diphosphokinase [Thaumarchaeota archaeon]|nr:ribose-phosphate diphosphokinase [Nitrososphaerota archaeon]
MARFTVIGGLSSEQLARKIASRLKARYVGYELRIFPDGEGKITLKAKPTGKIIVVHSIYPPVDSNLVQVLALVSQARKYSSQVYAVIPYMGYARQDREFLPREVVTMSLVAKMFKAAGATRIIVVDIHSMMALRHFCIPAKNATAIGELVKYFRKLHLKDPLVVSPDMGGIERAKSFANLMGTGYIALEKHRDRKTGEVVISSSDNQEVRNRDLILVDDMISTGGSIVKATEHLKRQKCGRVFACCIHALLIGDAEKRIRRAGVTRIISTNTIPGKTGVVDVSPVIARAIS